MGAANHPTRATFLKSGVFYDTYLIKLLSGIIFYQYTPFALAGTAQKFIWKDLYDGEMCQLAMYRYSINSRV